MKRILFLDGGSTIAIQNLHLLEKHGEVVVITEKELGADMIEKYQPTEVFLDLIVMASREPYDLVILGHNQGAGLLKGKRIDPKHRGATIVVSTDGLDDEDKGKYYDLGYSRFMTRKALSELIKTELGL